MLVAYLAHPLGDSIAERGDNHSNAVAWVKFLVNSTQLAILAPWLLLGSVLTDAISEPRRVHDSLLVLERCDVLILCGGYITLHMHEEIRRANRAGIPVIDLTMMGVTPPEAGEDAAIQIVNRTRRMMANRPRRVWLPLLTLHDLESLKSARHALYTHVFDDQTAAVRILDRVIGAAIDTGI